MKGGTIANFCYILGMVGNADGERSYRQFCVPLSVCLGTPMNGGAIAKFVYPPGMIGMPMNGGAIANFVYPPGMIGKAHEGRSHGHLCVPLSV